MSRYRFFGSLTARAHLISFVSECIYLLKQETVYGYPHLIFVMTIWARANATTKGNKMIDVYHFTSETSGLALSLSRLELWPLPVTWCGLQMQVEALAYRHALTIRDDSQAPRVARMSIGSSAQSPRSADNFTSLDCVLLPCWRRRTASSGHGLSNSGSAG